MSLDKHSFGDGAALTWDVPALRPLPARRSGNVEPDALRLPFLLLSSSAHPIWVATTCNVMRYRPRPVYARPMGDCTHAKFPSPQWACPNLAGRTELGCHWGPTLWAVPMLGAWSKGCWAGVRRWR